MLNLSQLLRESQEISFFKKIISLRDPDIYLAENLKDYQENYKSVEFPWYKRFPFPKFISNDDDRIYILFKGIGLEKPVRKDIIIPPYWFILHDDSGQELVYWNKDSGLFPAAVSFEEMQEQGFKDNEWIEALVRCQLKSGFLSIADIRKPSPKNQKN